VLLSCREFKYELKNFTATRVIWIFSYSADQEELFDELVGDYSEFCAAVEPRQFMRRWAEMRNEFMTLIPRRAPLRPAVPAS
jgi:cell fate regulator YaaT (PSP1 superfamily)